MQYLSCMVLEHYIAELLYRYNCVTVPHFGAFLTQVKSAAIDEATHTFHPPSKVVSFNEQLVSNDGLLISHMAEVEKTSYEDILKQVAKTVVTWKTQLQKGERLSLSNIGELLLNTEGKVQFQPQYQVNYLTASFGMPSFVSPSVTRETLKEEVMELEEKIPFIITPERRQASSFRPYLKYAAILLLAVSTGLTGFHFFNEKVNDQKLARENAQEQVTRHIQEATFFDTTPLELPAISLKVMTIVKEKESTNIRVHHIVAGAFRIRKNADRKIRQLKRRGYNATYIGTNDFGLHMVNYDSYTDVDEALNALKSIKRTQSRDAWLLSTK